MHTKSLSPLQPPLPTIYRTKHGRIRAEKMRSTEAEKGMVEGGRAEGWNMRGEAGGKSKRGHASPFRICLFRNKSSPSHPISTELRRVGPRRDIYITDCCI